MKYFIYILLGLGSCLLIFSLFQLDFEQLGATENRGSIIGILSSLCVIIAMFILLQTRAIKKNIEEKRN